MSLFPAREEAQRRGKPRPHKQGSLMISFGHSRSRRKHALKSDAEIQSNIRLPVVMRLSAPRGLDGGNIHSYIWNTALKSRWRGSSSCSRPNIAGRFSLRACSRRSPCLMGMGRQFRLGERDLVRSTRFTEDVIVK